MEWAVTLSSFMASAVEFVEAFTIVLVVGVTINWRSSIVGALAAAACLAVIVAVFGVAIVQYVPLELLRIVVGVILVLFGLKWLKKALLRYSGLKSLHDEEAIYEETMAQLKASGDVSFSKKLQPAAVAMSFKSVLLEGLEVAFIVITFGSSSAVKSTTGLGGIGSATVGAVVAGLLVILLGFLVRAPLTKVPENSLKFVVGIMLTTFGTFWAVEGFGGSWPLSDGFLPILAAIYLLINVLIVLWLKSTKQRTTSSAATAPRS
ncbi:COG4280 domain-containing protein [Dictyobacter arantiisoli]|uniref:GDT1 family protein n=1 Tax=Dictyobacter arantiisoli TaxID=2014874 RepID=A0A5A5T6Y8_9CHLR|nr:hypothetical protein [Dictyobacter arantiisoli]GCF06773.1 hypothetical protein KDI_03370 [Dictyobacter arantiisoli]